MFVFGKYRIRVCLLHTKTSKACITYMDYFMSDGSSILPVSTIFFKKGNLVNKKLSNFIKEERLLYDAVIENLSCKTGFTIRRMNNVTEKEEFAIIVDSFTNLQNSYTYLQQYCSYLLGAISEEKFKEIAEKFVRPYETNLMGKEIASRCCLLQDILQRPLDVTDYAMLLNLNPSDIVKAFSLKK